MKVKVTKPFWFKNGVAPAGKEIEPAESHAKLLIKKGYAVELKSAQQKQAAQSVPNEPKTKDGGKDSKPNK